MFNKAKTIIRVALIAGIIIINVFFINLNERLIKNKMSDGLLLISAFPERLNRLFWVNRFNNTGALKIISAMQMKKNTPKIFLLKASLSEKENDINEVIAAYENCHYINPTNTNCAEKLMLLYNQIGSDSLAVKWATIILSTTPKNIFFIDTARAGRARKIVLNFK